MALNFFIFGCMEGSSFCFMERRSDIRIWFGWCFVGRRLVVGRVWMRVVVGCLVERDWHLWGLSKGKKVI